MKWLPLLVITLLLVSPVFAAAPVQVSSKNTAPVYINTRVVTPMLNLSLGNTSSGIGNVTVINVTVTGNATVNNIQEIVSGVFLLNATGSVVASATVNSSPAKYTVSIPAGINVSGNTNVTILVALNLTATANLSSNVSVSMDPVNDLQTDGGTVLGSFVNSSSSEIRDVHANVYISPNFVDTNVTNQTFVYWIIPTGRTPLNSTIITIPAGYNSLRLISVQVNGTNTTSDVINTTAAGYINITPSTPTNNTIKIWFIVNTNETQVNSSAFAVSLGGANFNGVSGDVTNSINVTTKRVLDTAVITPVKLAAFVNGTDYWEYNMTLNFSANAMGLIQFKMSTWTDINNNIIPLNASGVNYATLRNETNFATTGKFNVTSFYSDGITQTVTDGGTSTLILRMVIPFGTPISNSWLNTYSMLFRALPA